MRRSLSRSLGQAVLAGLVLAAAGAAVAEDTNADKVRNDSAQVAVADVPETKPPTRNLNTVPEDGLPSETAKGPDNSLVRQLMAARPNEDLIICVAGCSNGHDRVVYAQPIEKLTAQRPSAAKLDKGSASATPAGSSNDASDAATVDAPPSPASVARSLDPRAPAIFNGTSDGTTGGSSDKGANAVTPGLKGTLDSGEARATSDGATN
jgi:hypothetical protein